MHIVTKFLVVLAAVFSVLLSGLTVAYTANAERIVDEYQQSKNKIAGLQASLQALKSSAEQDRAQLENERDAFKTQLDELNTQLANLQRKVESLRAENTTLRLSESRFQAQIDRALGLIQTFEEADEVQTEELSRLRERDREATQREIQLTDRINDLESEKEVLTEQNRALQEQIQELAERQEGDQAAGEEGEAAAGAAPSDLRARVTATRTDDVGDTLIEIDAGENDGLREGMRLNISRDNFLASIEIRRVDFNESVGVVLFRRSPDVEIRSGDLVTPQF